MSQSLLTELRLLLRKNRTGLCDCNHIIVMAPRKIFFCDQCHSTAAAVIDSSGLVATTFKGSEGHYPLVIRTVEDDGFERVRLFRWQYFLTEHGRKHAITREITRLHYEVRTVMNGIWNEPGGATSRALQALVQLDSELGSRYDAVEHVIISFALAQCKPKPPCP